jgi:hypothetical protein
MAKSTIEQELRRLEKLYERLGYPITLPSPATESQIASVEETFGRPICNEIKELWRICNGSGRNALFIRFPTKLSDRNYRKNRDGSWNSPPGGVTLTLQNQKTGEDLGSHTAAYQLNWDIQSQFEFHSTDQAIAVWSRYLPYDESEWLSSRIPYFERDYRVNTTRVINRHWLPFAEGTLEPVSKPP